MEDVTDQNEKAAAAAIVRAADLKERRTSERLVFYVEKGRVTRLNLGGCQNLVRLPDEIKFLTELQCLDLDGCIRLEKIPREIGMLTKLESLDIRGCPLSEGSLEAVWNLSQLTTLCLGVSSKSTSSQGGLNWLDDPKLPDGVLKLNNLRVLCIINMKSLKELPATPTMFPNLRTLDVGDCPQLQKIPKEILWLPHLTTLNVGGCNQLQTTANEMFEASLSLKHVHFRPLEDRRLRDEMRVYMKLNRSRLRYLLKSSNVPAALWCIALSKVSADKDMLYLLLKTNPAIFKR